GVLVDRCRPSDRSQPQWRDLWPGDLYAGEAKSLGRNDATDGADGQCPRRGRMPVVAAPTHHAAVCHAVRRRAGLRDVAVLGVVLLSTACAPKAGWTRVGRVCAPADPPTICLDADPDQPVVLVVGDT